MGCKTEKQPIVVARCGTYEEVIEKFWVRKCLKYPVFIFVDNKWSFLYRVVVGKVGYLKDAKSLIKG